MSGFLYLYYAVRDQRNLGGKVSKQPCLPLYLWIAGPAEQTFLMCLNKQSAVFIF